MTLAISRSPNKLDADGLVKSIYSKNNVVWSRCSRPLNPDRPILQIQEST